MTVCLETFIPLSAKTLIVRNEDKIKEKSEIACNLNNSIMTLQSFQEISCIVITNLTALNH
jgi:frataxin-like iron-binding protein CyaY